MYGASALVAFCNCTAGKVDLSNLGLEVLPPEVLQHKGRLQQLKMANNRLTSLPDACSALQSLNTLVLDSNALTDVPKVGGPCLAGHAGRGARGPPGWRVVQGRGSACGA